MEKAFASADPSGMIRVIVTLKDVDNEFKQLKSESDKHGAGSRAALQGQVKRRAVIARHQRRVLEKINAGNFRLRREFNTLPVVALRVNKRGLAELMADPAVDVALERTFKPLLASSVPLILGDKNDDGSSPYDATLALNSNRGAGWTIAILDTGVESANAFISGKVVSEACYSTFGSHPDFHPVDVTTCPGGLLTEMTGTGTGAPCDSTTFSECNHGTLVAGVAAGDGSSYDGVATGANIMSVNVFSYTPPGSIGPPIAYESDVLKGLDHVLQEHQANNLDIASVLLAFGKPDPSCNNAEASAFETAIDNLKAEGIATITASGNAASSSAIEFPACLDTAISVGATNDSDERWVDSNEGTGLTLYAPGVDITSSTVGGGDELSTGTSFAAAHVAGAWAVLQETFPMASVDEITAKLTSTAAPVNGNTPSGAQRIQLNTALDPVGLTVVVKIDSAFGGTATVADFNVTVDSLAVDWPKPTSTTSDSKYVSAVVPKSYELSEIEVDGYTSGTWTCADTDGQNIPVTGTFDSAFVSVGAGKAVICEITNTQLYVTSFFVVPLPNGGTAVFDL